MALFVIDQEIEIPFTNDKGEQDYDYINVTFTVYATYGNLGIGGYEYWGTKGYDIQMGWEIDEVKWNKDLYSPEVNEIIDNYLDNNIDSILDKIEKR